MRPVSLSRSKADFDLLFLPEHLGVKELISVLDAGQDIRGRLAFLEQIVVRSHQPVCDVFLEGSNSMLPLIKGAEPKSATQCV